MLGAGADVRSMVLHALCSLLASHICIIRPRGAPRAAPRMTSALQERVVVGRDGTPRTPAGRGEHHEGAHSRYSARRGRVCA